MRYGHIKRPRDGANDDQEPSAGTDWGSKRKRSGKEPESTSALREKTTTTVRKTTTGSKTHKQSTSQSAIVEETMQSTDVFEAPAHQDNLARRQDPRESFDELTNTTFDFSAFGMNRLNVTTLTPELLVGPTFELMKGTCQSLTELEYFCEEVYKANTEKIRLDQPPKGRQYPLDLRKPHRGSKFSRSSFTKTKAADYGQIKWIEDLVPNSMWSQVIVSYDKFALWGISHWGKKRRQFYAFATTRESARDVYSKRRIFAVTKGGNIVEWAQLPRILTGSTVRRDDGHSLQVQKKVISTDSGSKKLKDILNVHKIVLSYQRSGGRTFNLGVESYQKKLNLTKPDTYISNLRRRDAYTPYSDPRGFIYENKDKKNRLMCIDELKVCDGTLDDVLD
ncbi:hypothetical protein Tco_0563946 [Tanacetum coccineum]